MAPVVKKDPTAHAAAVKVAEAGAQSEWAQRTADWEAMAKAGGIKLPPGAKINPADVRVEVGPPMDEKTFKEWHAKRMAAMKNLRS